MDLVKALVALLGLICGVVVVNALLATLFSLPVIIIFDIFGSSQLGMFEALGISFFLVSCGKDVYRALNDLKTEE